MELYNYFRSSASYRVRIALALKGLEYRYVPVHLLKSEQLAAAYADLSPTRLVPLLKDDGGHLLTQSLAIVEYLEETCPHPPLLPADAMGRARVRALALDIACEIHPLNNLRVLRYLVREMKVSEEDKNRWYRHWVLKGGLEAVEALIEGEPFCFGDGPSLADICLIPQVFNARRYKIDISHLTKIEAIDRHCNELAAFKAAHPAQQPDAE